MYITEKFAFEVYVSTIPAATSKQQNSQMVLFKNRISLHIIKISEKLQNFKQRRSVFIDLLVTRQWNRNFVTHFMSLMKVVRIDTKSTWNAIEIQNSMLVSLEASYNIILGFSIDLAVTCSYSKVESTFPYKLR